MRLFGVICLAVFAAGCGKPDSSQDFIEKCWPGVLRRDNLYKIENVLFIYYPSEIVIAPSLKCQNARLQSGEVVNTAYLKLEHFGDDREFNTIAIVGNITFSGIKRLTNKLAIQVDIVDVTPKRRLSKLEAKALELKVDSSLAGT